MSDPDREPREFNCPHCPLTFLNYQSLGFHLKSFHPAECGYKCEIHNKLFLRKQGFDQHYKDFHTHRQTLECTFPLVDGSICRRRFQTNPAAKIHLERFHKLTRKETGKWIKLVEAEEESQETDLPLEDQQDDDMNGQGRDTNEILNILTKDYDDDIPDPSPTEIKLEQKEILEHTETPQFEIIDRKFSEDLDYEFSVERPRISSTVISSSDDNESNSLIPIKIDAVKIKKHSHNKRSKPKRRVKNKIKKRSETSKTERQTYNYKHNVKSILQSDLSTTDSRRIQPRRLCSKDPPVEEPLSESSETCDEETFLEPKFPPPPKKRKMKIKKEKDVKRKSINNYTGKYRVAKNKDGQSIYYCLLCEKVCYSFGSLRYHILFHHSVKTENGSFSCTQCNITFKAEVSLKCHLTRSRVHMTKFYKCPDPNCSKTYTRANSLNRHYSAVHERNRHYCITCGVSYGREDVLACHLKSENHAKLTELRISKFLVN